MGQDLNASEPPVEDGENEQLPDLDVSEDDGPAVRGGGIAEGDGG